MRDIPKADHDFEFVGGSVALDFANTLGGMHTAPTHEHLIDYADLVAFGRLAGTISPSQARRLLEDAYRHPARAAAVLRRAIALRETIWRVFAAAAKKTRIDPADLETIHREDLNALAHVRFEQDEHGVDYDWSEEILVDRPIWAIARAASELLRAGELTWVRECGSATCEWLFIDRSRSHTRRWCDMNDCGSEAKVRRFRQRHRRAPKAKSTR
jgi:predicted RNA-binding Zn ribbon-like protein